MYVHIDCVHIDAMNHSATDNSPYELVFGQKPRAVLFPGDAQDRVGSVVMEEDLERDGVMIVALPLQWVLPLRRHC